MAIFNSYVKLPEGTSVAAGYSFNYPSSQLLRHGYGDQPADYFPLPPGNPSWPGDAYLRLRKQVRPQESNSYTQVSN